MSRTSLPVPVRRPLAALLGALALGAGGCAGGKSDPTDALQECGDASAISEDTLIAYDFKQSAHEMIVCGGLSNQLTSSLYRAAGSLLTDPAGAPEAFSFEDGRFVVRQDDVTMTVALACGDFSIGCSEGDSIAADPFQLDSYLVGAQEPEQDGGKLVIHFDEPGPLAGLLGQGRNPSSPLRLGVGDLASFENTITRLRANTVIDLATEEEDTTVIYSVRTGRIDIKELRDGTPADLDLREASAVRGDQTMTPLLWDIQNTPDGIQGRIEMEVRGGEVEYTVSYDYTAGTSEPFIEMACLESDDADDETVTDAR